MESRFAYKYDKRTKRLTAIICGAILLVFAGIYILAGGYLQAWIYSLLTAIALLYVLSIPRYIKVDDENLEIQCVVEMTRVEIRDISSIRKVKRKEYMKGMFPVLGSYGFFGYYGYYFNFLKWEMIKVYATELDNLVEIEDIYEQKYLVSCRNSARMIEIVMQSKLENAGREEDS